jgi:PAS domain S-box-containing protein
MRSVNPSESEVSLIAENAALRKQVRELGAFLESASIGLHRVGPDGTILWANKSELDLLGYTAEEYIGHNITEFHADRDVIDNILNCLSRGDKLCERRARLRCKDGSVKEVVIDSSVLFEDGRFIHTQCFTRDVTEKVRVEDALKRIAFIVNHSGWSVATINSETNRIEFCNAAFAQMHGYAPEEVAGLALEKMLAPEWMALWPTHRLRLARGGDYVYESMHVRKDGTVFPVRTHATTFLDAEGNGLFRASVFTDITQEKRTQHALEETEALKTAMLNSGLDAFIAIDEHSLVVEFNSAAEQIFGYKRDTVLGRRLTDLIIPPSLREQHERGMARHLTTGETRILGKRIEIQAMRADGSEFPCELTVARVNHEGPPIFTSFIRDITQRKRAEAALSKANSELEEQARKLEATVAERTAHLRSTIWRTRALFLQPFPRYARAAPGDPQFP